MAAFRYAADHPAVSHALTHFTGRSGNVAPGSPTAAHRLASILWQGTIHGSAPYRDGPPAVSFTESRGEDLQYLIGRGYFQPWGVVTYRDDVYAAGGAPVWSVRTEVLPLVPPELRVWTSRLEPGYSEWLHEREWRIPAATANLGGSSLRIMTVIVGDPNWRPASTSAEIDPTTARLVYLDRMPPLVEGIQPWWWNPTSQRLEVLAPWRSQYHPI